MSFTAPCSDLSTSSAGCCLYLSSAPRIALLLWLNKSVHRRECPTWDLPALAPNMSSAVVHLEVNHPLMPRLSAKALACSLGVGMHQLHILCVDFGCSSCSAFRLKKGASKWGLCRAPLPCCDKLHSSGGGHFTLVFCFLKPKRK